MLLLGKMYKVRTRLNDAYVRSHRRRGEGQIEKRTFVNNGQVRRALARVSTGTSDHECTVLGIKLRRNVHVLWTNDAAQEAHRWCAKVRGWRCQKPSRLILLTKGSNRNSLCNRGGVYRVRYLFALPVVARVSQV